MPYCVFLHVGEERLWEFKVHVISKLDNIKFRNFENQISKENFRVRPFKEGADGKMETHILSAWS